MEKCLRIWVIILYIPHRQRLDNVTIYTNHSTSVYTPLTHLSMFHLPHCSLHTLLPPIPVTAHLSNRTLQTILHLVKMLLPHTCSFTHLSKLPSTHNTSLGQLVSLYIHLSPSITCLFTHLSKLILLTILHLPHYSLLLTPVPSPTCLSVHYTQ